MKRLIAAVSLIWVAPVAAQDGPSFDCAQAEDGSTEALICATPELAALDARLSDRFGAAVAVVRRLDNGSEAAEAELRAYQRGWIRGRDECWKAEGEVACLRSAYLTRENELVTQWMLDEPTSTAFWICDGNPANELVTVFFDTDLPSLRFERGDSIDTGHLVPSGSGARYEGSFGRSIWIKGEKATYREPDPNGASYACELTSQE